jgi:hypothetical protein
MCQPSFKENRLIGPRAVFQDLIPVVVLLAFGLIVWLVARSKEKWWRHGMVWLVLALVLFLSYSYLTGIVAGLRGFYFLRTLQANDIQSISVDNVTATQSSAILDFSSAFHRVQWFAASHGGWAKEVPLRIRLKSGGERTFSIGRYLRQPGVVIQGMFHTPWSYRMYDCGFSADLPEILESLKITLPASR